MVFSRLFGAPGHPRESQFAGLFYPERADELRALVTGHMREPQQAARAVIVPHSDLRLVAPVCGEGFGALDVRDRIVVVAPSHKIPFAGLAVPNADGWRTPLGMMKIDVDAYDGLGETGHVRVVDPAFDAEPGVEVQLPWLQVAAGDAQLVPMLCGDAKPAAAVEVLDALVDEATSLVVAAELSRDLQEREVRARDERTLRAVESLDPSGVERDAVTARALVQALIELAERRGWEPRMLNYSTSVDLGSDTTHAAGYVAVGFAGARDG